MYSKRGKVDITELVVIDKTTQCERCKERNAKEKSFCNCGSILPQLQARMKETLKETTKLVMIRSSTLQWRKRRTRGHERSLTPESLQNRKASLPKSTKKLQVQHIDGKRTQITVSACRKTAASTRRWKIGIESQVDHRKSTKRRRSKGRSDSAISGTLFAPQQEDPTRCPRVNILNLDKLTALAWTMIPRSG